MWSSRQRVYELSSKDITPFQRIHRAMFDWLPWFFLFGLTLYAISKTILIAHNFSDSLPGSWYVINRLNSQVIPGGLQKGDIIGFKYYGEVYPHGTVFAKHMAGMPGDVVTEKDREFFINGISVGKAKEKSLLGEPLEMNSFRGVIPAGKFWYATDSKDGFDSRYQISGLGDFQDIIGKAYLLF